MGGGLESRCVGRVYGANGAVRRTSVYILTFFVNNIFIYASCREEMYAIRRLQRRPKSVELWCEVWNSRINVYKNQAVYFCHGNGPVEFDNALNICASHGTINMTYAAALKTTTHPKTRRRKPYAATQHLMLLMMGVCTRNMSS